jgi:CheY-like chemotaxis protein
MALPKSRFRHVLLADDDHDDCDLFEDALAEAVCDTQLACASNGDHLMQMLNDLEAQRPDIIFLDLNMPVKNGIDCLREIKGSSRLADIPVVIISTSALQAAIDATYDLKANFYFKKPDTFVRLKEVLQKILCGDWALDVQVSKDQFYLGS